MLTAQHGIFARDLVVLPAALAESQNRK